MRRPDLDHVTLRPALVVGDPQDHGLALTGAKVEEVILGDPVAAEQVELGERLLPGRKLGQEDREADRGDDRDQQDPGQQLVKTGRGHESTPLRGGIRHRMGAGSVPPSAGALRDVTEYVCAAMKKGYRMCQRFLSATRSLTPVRRHTSERSSSAIASGGSCGE